jgi:hypothetical protein
MNFLSFFFSLPLLLFGMMTMKETQWLGSVECFNDERQETDDGKRKLTKTNSIQIRRRIAANSLIHCRLLIYGDKRAKDDLQEKVELDTENGERQRE